MLLFVTCSMSALSHLTVSSQRNKFFQKHCALLFFPKTETDFIIHFSIQISFISFIAVSQVQCRIFFNLINLTFSSLLAL